MEVYISTQNDVNYFQVLSPLLQMPPENVRLPLYQRLLELNLQLTSATLGVYLDIVYLFSEMKLSGLDQARIQNAIIQMAAYANELDSKLVAEFGGKLYSEMSPSP
ncbi:MAG: YbjN domain-containing protein [Anaerolineaceae bacterium]|nr:YbjN domain-containing protein [Anaerolineaceae bacterium]